MTSRIVVADDAVLLREGLASLLADSGFEVVGQAGSLPGLLEAVAAQRPDLVITDIRMPPTMRDEGIAAAAMIPALTGGRTAVLVLSEYLEVAFALRVLEAGGHAMGYLLKQRIVDVAQLLEAVRRVLGGGVVVDPAIVVELLDRRRRSSAVNELTPRERDVLGLMAEGRSNAGIADRLVVSEKTVEGYVGTVFAKLGLEPAADDHRRVLAVLVWLRDR